MMISTEVAVMAENTSSWGAFGCECKVGRVSDTFGIGETEADLVRQWRQGEISIRDCQKMFNKEVLQVAIEGAVTNLLDGEVENLYRLLTSDDVSEGMRTQAHNRLEREGVDADRIVQAFVSHQTVYRHLRDCLGMEQQDSTSDSIEQAIDRIRRLRSRAEAVTNGTLESLQKEEDIYFGDTDILVNINVICNECGTQSDIVTAAQNGGCACEPN